MPFAFNDLYRGKNALIGFGQPQPWNPGIPIQGGIQQAPMQGSGLPPGGMPFEGGMYQGGKFGGSPYQPYQPGGIPQGGIPFESGYQQQPPQQMPMGVNQMRMIWGNYRRPGMMGIRQKY